MVGVSASVNLPLHHKVQKFSSGSGSPGWSRKNGRKTVVVVVWCYTRHSNGIHMHMNTHYTYYCFQELVHILHWQRKYRQYEYDRYCYLQHAILTQSLREVVSVI